ncbi:MAG: T9SS type A sorting domain-containing protein [bacterium]|nr:MAG: T9SS type A sorting domain-containing protein [bacterium]
MGRHSKYVVAVFILLIFLGIPSLQAYWVENGVAICTATGWQQRPQITSDGAGGVIIVWEDQRSGGNDVYVQRIDAGGNVQWVADGVIIGTGTGDHLRPQTTSNGAGGAVITWQDSRSGNYDIYAQRIDAGGNLQWTTNGVAICTEATGDQYYPEITTDGSGGAIITWQDRRSGNWDIYARRIDAGGTVQWAADGLAICTVTGDQQYPQITSDGAGGCIITWQDRRSGSDDIYAQRIDGDGSIHAGWIADGEAICTAAYYQERPQITSDGAGGAVITWYDGRSGPDDIYAQRIDGDGSIHAGWIADGEAICTATGDQESPQITSDDAGGGIITWRDERDGKYDIYARRIDADGNVQWTADGVAICTAIGNKEWPQITSDGAGGAVITWRDHRTGVSDIYARRIDTDGNVQWTADGVSICIATDDQRYPEITSDGAGGAVITWYDYRNGNYDVYAQQVNRDGRVGYLPPEIHSVLDVPGDEGGWVNIAWDASRYDPAGGEITHYTIWRSLSIQAAALMLDGGAVLLTGTEQIAREPDKPLVRMQLLYGQTYYWELIDSHDAYYLEGYSKIVPTAFDSSAATSDYHYFQVIAHTSDPMRFYVSAPDSGYSVDNLAPVMPLGLAGEQVYVPEGLTLTWDPNTEIDLSNYGVYRGLNEGFVPGPANLIASPCDTILFDDEWRWNSGYFYKVSAIDIHGNESPFALLRPEDVTGEDVPETPRASFLSQNFPNPFNPQTKIAFGIREMTDVSLRIYNVSGHLVRVLVEERREAGRYEETWDGKDIGGRPVASGVYFYRLNAGAFTETKKMVLMR